MRDEFGSDSTHPSPSHMQHGILGVELAHSADFSGAHNGTSNEGKSDAAPGSRWPDSRPRYPDGSQSRNSRREKQ